MVIGIYIFDEVILGGFCKRNIEFSILERGDGLMCNLAKGDGRGMGVCEDLIGDYDGNGHGDGNLLYKW